MLTALDIANAVKALGVNEGDILNVHSSLRALGEVDGGVDTVIRGLEKAVGKEGTLVMPTLCQVDFKNSYKTWYMDKPSDVGYLTEYFRKQPYVYRSNHPTHSVAARGKLAYELTYEHAAYGPHLCPYGEYAFADSSPWNKMYNLNAKVLFLGVTLRANTFKHVIESRVMEHFLGLVKDPVRHAEILARVRTFETYPYNMWCGYAHTEEMVEELTSLGILKYGKCGDADCILFESKLFCDTVYEMIITHPEKHYAGTILGWVQDCIDAAE